MTAIGRTLTIRHCKKTGKSRRPGTVGEFVKTKQAYGTGWVQSGAYRYRLAFVLGLTTLAAKRLAGTVKAADAHGAYAQ